MFYELPQMAQALRRRRFQQWTTGAEDLSFCIADLLEKSPIGLQVIPALMQPGVPPA